MKCAVRTCLLLLVGVTLAWANSSGAPTAACGSRTPLGHGGAVANPTANPYTLTPAAASVVAGGQITVRLSGAAFKGYVVQAAADADPRSPPIGRFLPVGGSQTTLSCSATDDTITHVNSNKVDMPFADLTFKAPPGVQQVYFRATVVPELAFYFTDVYSLPVAVI